MPLMKKEVRVLGIDDSPFNKFKDKTCLIVGTFYRGGNFPDGVLSATITVDGDDATQTIIRMVNKSKFKKQLHCIMLDGINMAGFNVIDIKKVYKKTRVPVLVVVRKFPDYKKIKSVLKKIGVPKRFELLEQAGKPIKTGKIYIQFAGLTERHAKALVKLTATHSFLPEPIRLAHLIGAGIVKGESKGNA